MQCIKVNVYSPGQLFQEIVVINYKRNLTMNKMQLRYLLLTRDEFTHLLHERILKHV